MADYADNFIKRRSIAYDATTHSVRVTVEVTTAQHLDIPESLYWQAHAAAQTQAGWMAWLQSAPIPGNVRAFMMLPQNDGIRIGYAGEPPAGVPGQP